MATAKGFDALAAFGKAATWGTAVSVNVANALSKIVSENVSTTVEYIPDESLSGSPWKQAFDIGLHNNSGTIDVEGKYYGLELLLAMSFYRASTPVIANKQPSGNRPYAYYMDFRLPIVTSGVDTDGYFFTMAIDKSISVWEYDSVKVQSLQISGEAGRRVRLQFGLLARRMRNTGQVNTTLSSATEPLPRIYIVFSDAKFRLNAQSGSALANGTDQFYPSAFEINLANGLDPIVTSENDPYIDEPTRNEFGVVSGTFTIPTYSNDTNVTSFLAGTKSKADIKFISSTQIPAVGGGSYYYAFNIFLPQIQITEASRQVAGPGRIPGTVSWEATKPDSAPSGMDGTGGLANSAGDDNGSRGTIVEPMRVEVMNVAKTNPLA